MATFMDISLFQNFTGIFLFLLVFAVSYGFLSIMELFKKTPGSRGLYAIIALTISFLVIVSPTTFQIIMTMTPWFAVLIIFIFLIFFVLKMWAGDDDNLFKNLIKEPSLYWILIIIFVLILIVSLSSTFGQQMLDNNPQLKTLSNGDQVVQLSDGTVLSMAEASDQGYDLAGMQEMQDNPTSANQLSNGATIIATDVPSTQAQATATTDFSQNVLATIIHPKVLGLILFMLIGFLTIIFLAKSTNPD